MQISEKKLKDIQTSIFFDYVKASGPIVSCVMTSLLQKKPWQSTFIYTLLGKLFKYKEPPKVFVMMGKYQCHTSGSWQAHDVSH